VWACFDKFLQLLPNSAYRFSVIKKYFDAPSLTVNARDFMKIHSLHFQICCYLAACLPLPSHAGVELPYWLYPEWMVAKVMAFHERNTERIALAQAQTQNQAKTTATTALAPVETATTKVNEKHLSKEELLELRKQLRDKP
jgi:hypothetical protein